jgi:hypothetical protein
VRVWDPRRPDAPPIVLAGHRSGVWSVAWAPDGRLASGSRDGTVRVWDPRRPDAPPLVLTGHTATVRSVAWAPDGRLASGSSDGTVRVWDPRRSDAPPVVLTGHTATVRSVAWAPDGRLASGSTDLTVRVWDPSHPTRSLVVPRALGWGGRRLTIALSWTPNAVAVALHPFLGTDVAVVLPGSEHLPPQPLDAARPARRRVVRADRVATLADGALHLYHQTDGGDVWKATALPGLYPACLGPNVDGDLVLQGPDLRALEALLDAVPTESPPAWSALPTPFRVVDGQLRALGHDVDLARIAEVHTAAALKDGHWVLGGADGVLVLVAPDGQHALRFRLRGTDGPRTESVGQIAVVEDTLFVSFDGAEPVRARLPRFGAALRIGRGGTTPPAGPRLLAGPVRPD